MAEIPNYQSAPQYSANVARGKNVNYLVQIQSTAGISLVADMPESMNITISNSWEPRFSAGLNEMNGSIDMGTRLIGENIMVQEFSRMMWMNTTPIELPLTLTFDARKSAFYDVFQPMRALELLALPDLQGPFLTAPGPSARNPNRNRTQIFVGRMWYFPSVLVTSVTSSYDSRMSADGYPISGQTEITFSTDMVYAKADWARVTGGAAALSGISAAQEPAQATPTPLSSTPRGDVT